MGIDLHDILCPLCSNQSEDVEHTFLKCSWAESLWTRISQWWNIPTPNFESILGIFEWLDKCRETELTKEIMKTTIIANINLIWDHRNGVIFDKKEISIDLAFVCLQEQVAFWIDVTSA
ncbi:hypothetical protein LXL04_034520 [Taraxacum kok-saghyz]